MAQFNSIGPDFMRSLTDCVNFMDSYCGFAETCLYRHSSEAKKQLNVCRDWPDRCRKIQCRFRHPALLSQPKATALNSSTSLSSRDSAVGFFWDIENVPIPRRQRPFDIVQRIRQKLVVEPGLQEVDFSCYCNINTISQENQQNLSHAAVRIVHVPDRKPGAVDRQIMLDLDRFERARRPPATVVLISGDIDFVGKLSDLRHHAGFHVIVIHNKPAKEELKATVNEHYPWELFTSKQATASTGRPHFNNNQRVYDDRSSQSTPTSLSNRVQSRTLVSDSWNNGNLIHKNTLTSSTSFQPLMQQQPVRAMQQRRVDSAPTFPSHINQPSFPVYYYNGENNVPQYPSSSAMLSNAPVHRSTNNGHFESNNISSRSIGRGANRTNRKMNRERNAPRDCPFCEAEFDTIQALRQHQEDTSHLYGCPVCDQDFFTYEGQIQHQKAKEHDPSEDSDTLDDDHPDSGKNGANEPVSTSVVVRGFIEIMREIFK